MGEVYYGRFFWAFPGRFTFPLALPVSGSVSRCSRARRCRSVVVESRCLRRHFRGIVLSQNYVRKPRQNSLLAETGRETLLRLFCRTGLTHSIWYYQLFHSVTNTTSLTAVIEGVIHDTCGCSRGGTRCVYRYYIKPAQ